MIGLHVACIMGNVVSNLAKSCVGCVNVCTMENKQSILNRSIQEVRQVLLPCQHANQITQDLLKWLP